MHVRELLLTASSAPRGGSDYVDLMHCKRQNPGYGNGYVGWLTHRRAYSGIVLCLRGGWLSSLLRSARSAAATWWRVAEGGITASTKPRSAAP